MTHIVVVTLRLSGSEDQEDEAHGRRLDAVFVLRHLAEVRGIAQAHKHGHLGLEEGDGGGEHITGLILPGRRCGLRDGEGAVLGRDALDGRHDALLGGPVLVLVAADDGPRAVGGLGAVGGGGHVVAALAHALAPPLRGVAVLRLDDLHHLVAVRLVEGARADEVVGDGRGDKVEGGGRRGVWGHGQIDKNRAPGHELAQEEEVVELDRGQVRSAKLHLAILGFSHVALEAIPPVRNLPPFNLVVGGDFLELVHLHEDGLCGLPRQRRAAEVADGRLLRYGAVHLGRVPLEKVSLEAVAREQRGRELLATGVGADDHNGGERVSTRRPQVHRRLFALHVVVAAEEAPAVLQRALVAEPRVQQVLHAPTHLGVRSEHAINFLVGVGDSTGLGRVADDHHGRIVGGVDGDEGRPFRVVVGLPATTAKAKEIRNSGRADRGCPRSHGVPLRGTTPRRRHSGPQRGYEGATRLNFSVNSVEQVSGSTEKPTNREILR